MKTLLLLLAFAGTPEPSITVAEETQQILATDARPRAVVSGDEVVLVGQMAELSAEESENAKTYVWHLRPKPLSMRKGNKEGSVLLVSHNRPEVFEVELIISSPTGEIDTLITELEVGGAVATPVPAMEHQSSRSPTIAELASAMQQFKLLQETLNPVPVQQMTYVPQQAMPSMPAMAGMPVHTPGNAVSWPDGIRALARQVPSNTRNAEGVIIAGSFRSVAARIKTGTFSGEDPWVEAIRQSKDALGNAWSTWGTFFTELAKFVGTMKQQGILTNPQSCVLFLESAAQSLSSL